MKNTLYISQLTHIKDIEERNKVFNEMGRKDKRREIALDVLSLIKLESIEASDGFYWDDYLASLANENAKVFQKKLLSIKPKFRCEVCGRGAIMLSTIRLGNEIQAICDDYENYHEKGNAKIVKGFTMPEMLTIERVFEDGIYYDYIDMKYYHHPYEDNTIEMLTNIMLNILHHGIFKPKDVTDYLDKYPEYKLNHEEK